MTAGRVAAMAAEADRFLAHADRALAAGYPGPRPGRQPVHTVYVPADRFCAGLAAGWGRQAAAALETFAPGPGEFGAVMGVPAGLAADVRSRVLAKLTAEPVEDLRLDFEDGYGLRGDDAEDADVRGAAACLAAEIAAGAAPGHCGVRCKSLEPATRRRAIRTLDGFLAELLSYGGLPDGFVVTLPKVTSADQVTAMVRLCEGLDDYSAALGIAAHQQSMEHPVADHARAVMQVAAAGTGVRLSDGSSNVLPEGSAGQVIAAWELHARLVRRSLERGYYQGWDLHPAQLASRYAATFGFFTDGLETAADRLRGYLERAGGPVLEEPATARALAGFLARGLDCGAVTEPELTALTGLDRPGLDALR
jgi:hypothetical protein